MDQDKIVETVELATRLRGDAPVADWRIKEALRRIEAGEVKVNKYPSGMPLPTEVHRIALKMF